MAVLPTKNPLNYPCQMSYTRSERGDDVGENRTILTCLHKTIEDYIGSLSSQDAPVVGWCCSYSPVEVLESAGLVPFRLLPLPPAEMGDAYLDPNFCPYVRAVLGEGLAGAYPFLSGLVIMNTCDGMRRLSDAWSSFHDIPFVYLMDLPRITTPPAIARFREETQKLMDRISCHFGVSVSTETMRACFEASNRTHALFRQVQGLMSQGELHLAGWELVEILRAGGILPREKYNPLLERVTKQSDNGGSQKGVPILVTGPMLENPEIVSMIEACGGRVVAQDLCVTGRQPEDPISLSEEPLMALARHYLLRPPCARMQENQRRIEYLLNLVRFHQVQGVIYYVLKFCDTFLYEIPVLKQTLNQIGIPMLIIESEYRKGRGGGVQTRIQAFLEMLNRTGNPDQRETDL